MKNRVLLVVLLGAALASAVVAPAGSAEAEEKALDGMRLR